MHVNKNVLHMLLNSINLVVYLLPKFSSAHADSDTLSLEVQHRESHSIYQEHQEGTSGCNLGISMVIFFPQELDFASCIWRDDHPFGNLSF